MKISETISAVDAVKPNAFTTAGKLRWLNSLEGRIASEVFLMAPAELGQFRYTEADAEKELLLNPPHDDIYVYWLQAQIDFANGEYNRYQNTMQMFNANWGDFERWFALTYAPAQGYLKRI